MKKGIAVSLIFALLLCVPSQSSAALSIVSAEKEPDAVLAESFDALLALNTVHMDMDMALDMNMVISYGGQQMAMPMSLTLNASIDEQMDPVRFQGKINMDMNAMGSGQSQSYMFYIARDGDVLTAYVSEDDGASWDFNQSEGNNLPQFDTASIVALISDNIRDFRAIGTETIDGTDTVVYSGTLDIQFLQQLLEKADAADALSELTEELGIEGGIDALGDLGFTMYIDPTTHLPLKYAFDMTDMLKNVLNVVTQVAMGLNDMEGYEMSVEIDAAILNCRLKDFNALPALEVPAEIKATVTELPSVTLTTDYSFSQDPTATLSWELSEDRWSVIGSFLGTNWDKDFPMAEAAPDCWISAPLALKAGNEFKVRMNGSWAVNRGVAGDSCMQDGPNVVVEKDGTYIVTLDLANEKLTFAEQTKDAWCVIGSILGTNWDTDFPMVETTAGVWQSMPLELKAGDEYKVRMNGSWAVNYGISDGALVQDGANIVIHEDGTYVVVLDLNNYTLSW